MLHIAIQAHRFKVRCNLHRWRNVQHALIQSMRQLLMLSQSSPLQQSAQCRTQQTIFWPIALIHIMLGIKALVMTMVIANLLAHQQLTAQHQLITLLAHILTTQATLHELCKALQGQANQHLKQRHMRLCHRCCIEL